MKNILATSGIVAAVVALIVSAGLWLVAPSKAAPTQEQAFGNVSTDGSQAVLPTPSNYDYLVARLALGLGTNTTNIVQEGQKSTLVAFSNIPCVIQNPFNATSSITSFAFNVTVAATTTQAIVVGTTTTATATSTSPFLSQSIPANTGAIVTWDPNVNNSLIAPGAYITAGNNASAASPAFGGICQATFQSVT